MQYAAVALALVGAAFAQNSTTSASTTAAPFESGSPIQCNPARSACATVNGTLLPASTMAANANATYTAVVATLTTYCPSATKLTTNGKVYTATGATTLTITDCPCTVTGKATPGAPGAPGSPAAPTGVAGGAAPASPASPAQPGTPGSGAPASPAQPGSPASPASPASAASGAGVRYAPSGTGAAGAQFTGAAAYNAPAVAVILAGAAAALL